MAARRISTPDSDSDPGNDCWALPAGADCDPAFARLHAYWRSKTTAGRLPARADIDPLEIPRDLLTGIALLEIEQHGDRRRYRLRLFGSDLEVMTGGTNGTGSYYDELTHQPGLYEKLDAALGSLIAERKPVYVAAPSGGADRGFLWFGRLALPLAADGRTVDMILALVRPLPRPPANPLPPA